MTDLASRSTDSPYKWPMAIVKGKMHKATQARGNFKIRCVLEPAACKEGVPRRKAVWLASSPSMVCRRALPSQAFFWAFHIPTLNMVPTWGHVDTPINLRVHGCSPRRITFASSLEAPHWTNLVAMMS